MDKERIEELLTSEEVTQVVTESQFDEFPMRRVAWQTAKLLYPKIKKQIDAHGDICFKAGEKSKEHELLKLGYRQISPDKLTRISDEEIEKCFGDEPQAQNFDQLLNDFYDRLKNIAQVQLEHNRKELE